MQYLQTYLYGAVQADKLYIAKQVRFSTLKRANTGDSPVFFENQKLLAILKRLGRKRSMKNPNATILRILKDIRLSLGHAEGFS